jgi:hypothetical protein
MTLRRLPGLRRNNLEILTKPFSGSHEDARKQARGILSPDQQWGSIMWAIINILYRQYCRARLVEIRKFELEHGMMS